MLACIGHWYAQLLYVTPVGLIGAFVLFDRYRHRDDEVRDDPEPAEHVHA